VFRKKIILLVEYKKVSGRVVEISERMQPGIVRSFWTQMGVQTERSRHPDKCCLTDERPDGIPRRPDGCKGLELHCLEFCIESS